jgi:hypothetical protein
MVYSTRGRGVGAAAAMSEDLKLQLSSQVATVVNAAGRTATLQMGSRSGHAGFPNSLVK